MIKRRLIRKHKKKKPKYSAKERFQNTLNRAMSLSDARKMLTNFGPLSEGLRKSRYVSQHWPLSAYRGKLVHNLLNDILRCKPKKEIYKYYQKLTNYNYMIEDNKEFNLRSSYIDPMRDHFLYWRDIAFGKHKTLKKITKII